MSYLLHHGDWRSAARAAPQRADGTACDALITDAPYSERTHAATASGSRRDSFSVRPLAYAHWEPREVRSFVQRWAPLTRGWMVSITDHALAPVWARAMEKAGRYVFAPLPYVAAGSRVRLVGDGPSSWTCWIVVSRPRCVPYSRWGTRDGAYVLQPGAKERMDLVGGKPVWLMERLVEDYSRRGDVVCDPCCGAGTTGVAAVRLGRRALLGDIDAAHIELARRRLEVTREQLPLWSERRQDERDAVNLSFAYPDVEVSR